MVRQIICRSETVIKTVLIVAAVCICGCAKFDRSRAELETSAEHGAEFRDQATPVRASTPADPAIQKLLSPYKAEVSKLNEPIGIAAENFSVPARDGGFGSVIADVILWKARKDLDSRVDAAFTNSGGIRAPLDKGSITRAQIMKVLPFENRIVILELDKDELMQLGQELANTKGGNPISGMEISAAPDWKLMSVLIRKNRLKDQEGPFYIATNSFLAAGGAGSELLKNARKVEYDVLLSDAFIEYIQNIQERGDSLVMPERAQRYFVEE